MHAAILLITNVGAKKLDPLCHQHAALAHKINLLIHVLFRTTQLIMCKAVKITGGRGGDGPLGYPVLLIALRRTAHPRPIPQAGGGQGLSITRFPSPRAWPGVRCLGDVRE